MRILLYCNYYYPALSMGGLVSNAVALAEGLAGHGHRVTVLTSNVSDLRHGSARTSGPHDVNGVQVYYLGRWLRFNKSQITPGALRTIRRAALEFDVLHIIGLFDPVGPTLARAARRRCVPYTIEPAGMLVRGTRSVLMKRVYHALAGRTLLHNADAVVVTSRQEADDAIAFGCEAASIRIRRNGVDLNGAAASATPEDVRRQLGIGPDQPLLLFLGRIDPMKNLSALLTALSGLRAEPWHLAIVGPAEDAAYCETLKDLARSLGLASRISWLGPRYGAAKRAVVAAADLMLLVSIRENWGNVIQEAIAAGVPTLVTRTCGVSDMLTESDGVVAASASEHDIRDGLIRAFGAYVGRARRPASQGRIDRDLTWEVPVQAMARLFEDLCGQARARETRI